MLHLNLHKNMVAISLVTLLCLGLSIFSVGSEAQQQKRVIKQKSWRDEPVKVSLLKVKGHPITLNQDFDEDEDWLYGLTISITNTSEKPIIYLSFRIDFPHPEGNSRDNPIPAYDFSYGHSPDSVNAILPDDTKPIMPKETKDFLISDNDYAIINELLRQSGYPTTIKRFDIVLDDIIFADNTLWRAGIMHKRDPNNPSKWIRINKTVGNLSNPNIRSPGYNSPSTAKGSRFSYMLAMNVINIATQYNMIPTVFAHAAHAPQSIGACTPCGYVYRSDELSCNGGICYAKTDSIDTADAEKTSVVCATRVTCGIQSSTGTPCLGTTKLVDRRSPCSIADGGGIGQCPPQDCGSEFAQNPETCECEAASPILIDVMGNQFNLTDNPGGVLFDINGDGSTEHLSWTSANSDDAWLTLDRNGNGTIDNGMELFGNFTPQSQPPAGMERTAF